MFAGISYWAQEKEKLELTMAERAQAASAAGTEEETPQPAGTTDNPAEQNPQAENQTDAQQEETKKDFIRWVDFGVSKFAMTEAYEYDRDTYGTDAHISWIDQLAYTAAYTGGSFDSDRTVCQYMDKLREEISQGKTLEKLVKDLEYFSYYQEAYTAVLGGMVGEYEIETADEDGRKSWEKRYGLKAFSPIAKGFPYTDYDDFGVSRSYGYKRNHLGHDMLGQVGTPIVCVESGYIEALGWNQYGGWRIGIRSFDKKRYYYYAHLRQGFPYQPELKEGSVVLAGDVIGYMGHTGYSTTEDVNNIDQTHLHFGMQIIFDESKYGSTAIRLRIFSIGISRRRPEMMRQRNGAACI